MMVPGIQHVTIQSGLILVFLLGCLTASRAQAPKLPDIAPPPLKFISREDRNQISTTKDAKARVKTTIRLAETHLTKAEGETTKQSFDAAAAAAGRYWALVDDIFGFLKTLNPDKNRTRDLYKRLELTLRAHGPRINAVRRSTPAEYAVWIKEIGELARKGRTEALNSFYGHTVFQERPQKPSAQKQGNKP